MRHLFSFLLLLALIRIFVGGIPTPVVIEDKEPERIRSKLTLDIIKTKKIVNPVFVATSDIEDEVLKPLTELQKNDSAPLLPLILVDYHMLDEFSYHKIFRKHKPISSFKEYKRVHKIIRIMRQMVSHENKVFNYIFLPPFVSYDGTWAQKNARCPTITQLICWGFFQIAYQLLF